LGGYQAIMPRDPDASELITRITSEDDDVRMPPADSHPPLSDREVATLRQWIVDGGEYELHWAFVPPKRVRIPSLSGDEWSRGPIDRFVLRKIRRAKLEPSVDATRENLIRRLYLDLIGVTPPVHQVDRFVTDNHPAAYQRLVDRLLASPQYAERFARPWLDLARYSDTNGYEKDRPRTMWPYRDWVIHAIGDDMPFDQFSIQQLAGDMLPDATPQQQIATGFHRNTMLNEEGGIDPLEYRFYAMVDRVATTGTVWLGLTTGCAQCHTHKYDPITHTDYYALMALMDNADEPEVVVVDEAREANEREIRRAIDSEVDRLVARWLPTLADWTDKSKSDEPVQQAFNKWVSEQISQSTSWQTLSPVKLTSTMPKLTVLEDHSILASGDVTKRDVYRLTFEIDQQLLPATALKLSVLPHESLPAGGPGLAFYEGRRGDFFLSELKVTVDGQPVDLENASHSYGKISVGSGKPDAANVLDGDGSTGWSTSAMEGEANRLVVNFADPITTAGRLEVELLFERHFAAALGRFSISLTADPAPAVAMTLPKELDDYFSANVPQRQTLDADAFAQLQKHFVLVAPELKQQRKQIERLQKQIVPEVRTLGMRQRDREDYRQTHRHHRGEYLQPKEVVAPAVPSLFESIDGPADRLSLAKWLVSEKNPLIGRVSVNRAWREFFGTGIVRTAGDFGTQSEPPSHPKLIDWLERDWRDSGWSLKRLHREIVLSSAYRQAVGKAPDVDSSNRLLSCFPYRRLDAERIRDAMLSASGLLSGQIGGASVYPPQPQSVSKLAYGNTTWTASTGADRFRRSLYTFSKRTAPFAALATFDGPTGELCVARRESSTTPLQALTLMNDAMYMEIARGLAGAAIRDAGGDDEVGKTTEANHVDRIAIGMFRRLLSRQPEPDEVKAIVAFYQSQQPHSEPWTLVARALMNTDEAITTP
ncbi:MAG: DUF1553 domain-containing protein, partial [Pirellulaceae bacterium]|nr:DUF1553 domain-containing protein [Pirellulaceae bacterium]